MVYQGSSLDATFAALAAPPRRAILARLATGEHTISELAAEFDMTLPGVSKHVYVLKRAGLARIRQVGRARHVRIQAEPLRDAAELLERYRVFWSQRLDELETFLTTAPRAATSKSARGKRSHAKTRTRRRST
jgi:DNA-binding transcriptional ArsR family regulator